MPSSVPKIGEADDDAHGGRQRNLADRVVEGGQLDRRAEGARGMLQRPLGAQRRRSRRCERPTSHITMISETTKREKPIWIGLMLVVDHLTMASVLPSTRMAASM